MKTHRIRPILLKKNTESINIGDLVLPNNPNKINEGNLGEEIHVRVYLQHK